MIFFGDSITQAGGYVDLVAATLLTAQPDLRVEVLNHGISSETISGTSEPDHAPRRPDAHDRFDRDVAAWDPDVVVACFGMNLEKPKHTPYNDGSTYPHGVLSCSGPTLAISYTRFSTAKQEHGDSQRRQDEGTADFCQRHKLILDSKRTFRDLGVSGYRGKNAKVGDLKNFLDLVESGHIPKGSTLILEKLDRLSRNSPIDQLLLIERILRADIRIATLQPDRFYTNDEINASPYVIYEIISHAMSGHEESRRKSHRNGEAWNAKRKLAVSGGEKMTTMAAPWLSLSEDRKTFIPIKERVAIVERIYNLALLGKGATRIAKELNAENIPSFGTSRDGKPCPWRYHYITKLLRDRRVLGELQTSRWNGEHKTPVGEPFINYYPEVIDVDVFNRVQLAVTSRFVKRGRCEKWKVNLFKGLLVNAQTGTPMGINSYRSGGKLRVRLVTRITADTGRGVGTTFLYDKLETALLTWLKELNPADFALTSETDSNQLASLSSALTLITDKINRVQAKFDNATTIEEEAIHYNQLERLSVKHNSIKADYDSAARRASSPTVETIGEVQGLIDLLNKSTDPESLRERIRARLRQLVESIWLLAFDVDNERMAIMQVNFPDSTRRYITTSYSLSRKVVVPWEGGSDRFPPNYHSLDLQDWRTLFPNGMPDEIREHYRRPTTT